MIGANIYPVVAGYYYDWWSSFATLALKCSRLPQPKEKIFEKGEFELPRSAFLQDEPGI